MAKKVNIAKAGATGLRAKFATEEEYRAHMSKNARKRWTKHPEQRSELYKAKKAARAASR